MTHHGNAKKRWQMLLYRAERQTITKLYSNGQSDSNPVVPMQSLAASTGLARTQNLVRMSCLKIRYAHVLYALIRALCFIVSKRHALAVYQYQNTILGTSRTQLLRVSLCKKSCDAA